MRREEVLEELRDVGVDARYVAVLEEGVIVPLNPRRAKLTERRRRRLERAGLTIVRSKTLERASVRAHRVITGYELFEPREEVAVGFSGGKDSLTCLLVLEPLTRRLGLRLRPVLIDVRLHGEEVWGSEGRRHCEELCRRLGLELEYVRPREDVGELAEEHDESPCLICSLIRRRELRERSEKIVLAHTLDDAVITALATAVKGEGVKLLPPKERLEGMVSRYVNYEFPPTTIVRPIVRVPEEWTARVPEETGLEPFNADCPYSKPYAATLRGKVAHGLEWLRLELSMDRVELLDRLWRSLKKACEGEEADDQKR